MFSYTVVHLPRDRQAVGPYSFVVQRDGVRVAEYRFSYRGEDDEINVTGQWIASDRIVEGGGPQPMVVSTEGAKFLDDLLARLNV